MIKVGDLVIVSHHICVNFQQKTAIVTEVRRNDGIAFRDQYVVRLVGSNEPYLLSSDFLRKL